MSTLKQAWAALVARWRAFRSRPPKAVRSPTVLQMEAVECGAAALAIVFAHHKLWVPLEELRLACGVSRDGSKASNIVKAARRYGFVARGFKKQPEDLRNLKGPMIIHWNFNHFVVLDGFGKKGKVQLNDPASGPRTISEEELDQSFTGVVLLFEPGPDFKRAGDPPSLVLALRRRLTGSGVALGFVILAGLFLVVPNIATPAFTKVFIDTVLLDNNDTWLRPLLLAMGITALLIASLTGLQQAYLLRLETKIALASSGRFFWHVLKLPLEFFSQRYAGDISTRVTINDRVAQLLSGELATNALNLVMVFFFAIILFQYDVLLTFVGIGMALLNVVALRLVARRRTDGNRRLLQEKGKLNGIALGGLQVIETIKATGGEADMFTKWGGYQAKVVNIRQDLERYTFALQAVPPLVVALNTAAILYIGSLRVMDGLMSIGSLIAFQVLMGMFVRPVNTMVGLAGNLQMAEGDMNRLDDVLRYQAVPDWDMDLPAEAESSGSLKLEGRLELHGLTFGYSRLSPPLIEGFELHLEPASRVALVGGSGSGKSTLAHLVNGLYEPWSGEILFDGKPRADWSRSIMVQSLASVDQNVFLFKGTIRENLSLWDPTIGLPEIIRAARDAAIHEDIAARPGGYDSLVTEGGNNFSGGQRQRLEIARALVLNPSILVLDEATSALDPTTEQWIDECLRRRGCTCLIVAHRLSTIRDADEIIVLEQGKVVQRGTHEELVAVEDGAYAKLIEDE